MNFLGCPYPIRKSPRGLLAAQDGVSQVKSDLLVLLLTNPGERCLTGDTKIPLVNGTESTIADLVDKPPFWVYSFDTSLNSVVAGKAVAHKTAENANLLDVELDNGQHVRCTQNHLWMLRNGTYCRTDELSPGNSLMPLYRNLNTSKYERVYQQSLGDYRETHLCFVEGTRLQGEREVVHHKNLNKRPDVREKLKAAWIKRRQKNHKIVSITKLTSKEDCYDLFVEKYHNFAISAGVFVHNCMLPTFGTPLRTLIFEPNDPTLADQAKTMIINSISTWEPRITVQNIQVNNSGTGLSLNPSDNGTENEKILGILIQFFDPENISDIQTLTLEIPLASG